MYPSFLLEVISPDGKIFVDQVESVILNGAHGQFSILANHEPLISEILACRIIVKKQGGGDLTIATTGGIATMKENACQLLIDGVTLE